MVLYGTILCAIDFSDSSADALRLGARLAARLGARLLAVHVIDRLLAEAAASRYAEGQLEQRTGEDLRTFVARAEAPPEARCLVRTGVPHEEILACAYDEGAGLVVMGTRGLGGLKKLFFGSVTERVLRDTRLPVLAVSRHDDDAPARTEIAGVLAAVEIDATGEQVLGHASRLASALHVPLSVLHIAREMQATPPLADAAERIVVDRRDTARARVADLVRACGCEGAATDVTAGAPAEQIARAAAEREDVVVVIGLGGRGVFHPPGSTAYRLLCVSPAPVLAVPGTDAPR